MTDQDKSEELGQESVNLDSGTKWLNFVIEEFEFEVEVLETISLLSSIDRDHVNDLNECLKCCNKFSHMVGVDTESNSLVCPKCKSTGDKIAPSQDYLDDVVDLMKTRWKVKRCSRVHASFFYSRLVEEHNLLKKNLS